VVVSIDGWIQELNRPARGILAIPLDSTEPRHFTDFVAPGTLEDSQRLFTIIAAGNELTATVLLNPTGGEVIGCDIHAYREGDRLVGLLRLAEDIEPVGAPAPPPTDVTSHPASDIAFRHDGIPVILIPFLAIQNSSGAVKRWGASSR
jgi:hypothetical protein